MAKKRSLYIVLILLSYLIIYNPPIFSINCIRIMMIPIWAYLLLNRKYVKKYINLNRVVLIEAIILAMLIYCCCNALIHSEPVSYFVYMLYWMFGDIPFAMCTWVFIKKRGQGLDTLILNIIATGCLMALTAIASLIVPSIKNYFTGRMLAYGVRYADVVAGYRNYGFAANMTSFASMLQAVLAGYCLYYATQGKLIALIAVPFLAVSAIINTRTSLLFLLAMIAVILFVLIGNTNAKSIARYVMILVLILITANGVLALINEYNPATYSWLTKGYESISSFISGSDRNVGYFGELDGMTRGSFPTGLNLLFGVGSGVMGSDGAAYGARSDVGFINDLWRGGIFFSLALLCSYIHMLRQIKRSTEVDKQLGKFISISFFVICILTNIKGSFFIHSDLTVVFWILYIAIVVNIDNKRISKCYKYRR